jgi:hypothetical protein
MHCELVMDEDDNGNQVVTDSDKVIFITDKTNKTKLDTISIGQLLALKVSENAKYSEIVGTTKRKPRTPAGQVEVPEIGTSLDLFDKFTSSYANFVDTIEEETNRKDMKNYNALLTKLNSAGGTDMIVSLNRIMNFIEALLSKPGISKKLADALADGTKKEKKAA